jgi:hypothetical protein
LCSTVRQYNSWFYSTVLQYNSAHCVLRCTVHTRYCSKELWSILEYTPGSTCYEYSTVYSSNTVQRTEWYAKLITTHFPINCEAPTSIIYIYIRMCVHEIPVTVRVTITSSTVSHITVYRSRPWLVKFMFWGIFGPSGVNINSIKASRISLSDEKQQFIFSCDL